MREGFLTGLDYLAAVTELQQRVRAAHPTKGLFEAADMQWWWRLPRSTDALDQLFWFDDEGRPEAAVIAIDWGNEFALVPIVMPDAPSEWVTHIIERGMAHLARAGIDAVDLEVDRADEVTQDVLVSHGFTTDDDSGASQAMFEAWIAADHRPEISPLHDDYRLATRNDSMHRPHHNTRGGPAIEVRLQETSLYRSDLDLVVYDVDDGVAAYGLFWFDPTTSTGMVEPMRTIDAHQRRGLARHILTTGLDRLADVGATRIKICFSPENAAASQLYLDVGFQPVKETVVFSRGTRVENS